MRDSSEFCTGLHPDGRSAAAAGCVSRLHGAGARPSRSRATRNRGLKQRPPRNVVHELGGQRREGLGEPHGHRPVIRVHVAEKRAGRGDGVGPDHLPVVTRIDVLELDVGCRERGGDPVAMGRATSD